MTYEQRRVILDFIYSVHNMETTKITDMNDKEIIASEQDYDYIYSWNEKTGFIDVIKK